LDICFGGKFHDFYAAYEHAMRLGKLTVVYEPPSAVFATED
jgi:hypothetical protein